MKRKYVLVLSVLLLLSVLIAAFAGCNKDGQTDTTGTPTSDLSTTVPETTAKETTADPTAEPTAAPTAEPTRAETTAPQDDPAGPKVVFSDKEGNMIEEVPIRTDSPVVSPEPPVVEGYTFIGWSGAYENATEDTSVRALYTKDITPSTTDEIRAWKPTYTSTLYSCKVSVYKDFSYGTRGDVTNEGDGFDASKGLGGWILNSEHGHTPYHRHRTGQYFDVYLPENYTASTPVLLYLHGGAWSQIYDKDGTSLDLLARIAASGYICVSADYIMQSNNTQDGATVGRDGATFAAMLGDIDLVVSYLHDVFLPAIGVSNENKIAVAGPSAGGHLAALYAYDANDPAKLGLSLAHKMEVGILLDIVGPDYLESFLPIAEQMFSALLQTEGPSPFRILFARLVGLNDDATDDALINAAAFWSPSRLIAPGIPAVILAYAEITEGAGTDGAIPTSTFDALKVAVTDAGATCSAALFVGVDHGAIDQSGVFPIKGTDVTANPSVWMTEQLVSMRTKLTD